MDLMHNHLKLYDCMLLFVLLFSLITPIFFFKFIIDEILHTES